FDDAAAMHHGNAVAEVANDRDVVADEDEAEAETLLDVEQQVEDLAADRDVQRRSCLVGDDDARIQRQRPRDPDALALPTREGVRVTLHRLRIDADQRQKFGYARLEPLALRA